MWRSGFSEAASFERRKYDEEIVSFYVSSWFGFVS